MTIIQLKIRATTENAVLFCQALQQEESIKSVESTSRAMIRRGILDRAPLRQTELFDIALALIVNLASSAAYDYVRRILDKQQKNKLVEAVEIVEPLSPAQKVAPKTHRVRQKMKMRQSRSKASRLRGKK